MRPDAVSPHEGIRAQVLERLGVVVDPCMEAAGLGLSLVDLGIVRTVGVDESAIDVELGLTEPGCGFTHALVTRVEDALATLGDAREIRVRFNWSDPWTEEMMTDTGRAVFAQARGASTSVLRRFDVGRGFRQQR